MLNAAATYLERMLVNQTAVIITPLRTDAGGFVSTPRPRAGTPGRISRIEDSRVWIEITLPYVDVDGVAWHCDKDIPSVYNDGIGICPTRTLEISLPQTAVAILTSGCLVLPGVADLINRPDILASAAVKTLARLRLREATAALTQVHELVMIGVDVDQDDDAELRAMVRELVGLRVVGRMRRRIQEFFLERPWFWQIKTSVHAYKKDFHVRVESKPDAPNPYQLDALEVLGIELTEMLEPESDPLSGRFNLIWEYPTYGGHFVCPTHIQGAATH